MRARLGTLVALACAAPASASTPTQLDPHAQKPPGPPTGRNSGPVPKVIVVPRAPRARSAVIVDARSGGDPAGTAYVYLWDFGDGTRISGHGHIAHRYLCAGHYRLRLTVIDTRGAHIALSRTLAVAFPHSATKGYRGLSFSPAVAISGRRAEAWLKMRRRRGSTARASSVDWRIDDRSGDGLRPALRAIAPIRLHRRHHLHATVHLRGTDRTVRVSACFYA